MLCHLLPGGRTRRGAIFFDQKWVVYGGTTQPDLEVIIVFLKIKGNIIPVAVIVDHSHLDEI